MILATILVAAVASLTAPNQARIAEIATKLPSAPQWAEDGIDAAANVKRADALLKEAVPDCADKLYLMFTQNGNRTEYEKPYFLRGKNLECLAATESKEGKGKYLEKVVEYLNAICSERCWTMPAHDTKLINFNGTGITIDLGAAHRSHTLARVLVLLKGRLPADVEAKVRAELERRIFAIYRKTAKDSADPRKLNGNWWFFCRSNWNAVCHSAVVRAALAVIPDAKVRAEFVEGAERGMKFFLESFLEDGYCTEGGGYWNYGYGNFLDLVLAVKRATGGFVDYSRLPRAKEAMEYGYGYRLVPGICPNFADGGASSPSVKLLKIGPELWPEFAPLVEGKLTERTFFPCAQVYIGRSERLAFAIKGGNNAELHNHNDIGSWTLVADGIEVAGDPGGEVYTARTFSKDRYVSKVLNSYGHPVPKIAGELQKTGAAYKGKILKNEFSAKSDRFDIDLSGAYECTKDWPGAIVRETHFNRAKSRLTLVDRLNSRKNAPFESAIVTYADVQKGSNGKTLLLEMKSKDGKKSVTVKVEIGVKGGDWYLEEELIENPGRRTAKRIAVVFDKPVKEATIGWRFSVADVKSAEERELALSLAEIFEKSAAHYKALDAAATPQMNDPKKGLMVPHGFKAKENRLDMRSVLWWTSGHYPGSLWYLYEATGDDFFRDRALVWTKNNATNSTADTNHDLGFIMYCSYGNARRLLNTEEFNPILVETAETLSRRFNDNLGLIRSWGKIDDTKTFLVIPDNMMNLELLMNATKYSGNRRFADIARSHADVTMKNHFDAEGGTFHVLNYDQKTGWIMEKRRGQGACVGTSWSRGQSWAIYGYTMMYRETGNRAYLDFARKVSDFAIFHKNMPEDGVPYWDFGAPGEERDSSAASIMAAGLLELSTYVPAPLSKVYRDFAVKQLRSLASPAYYSAPGENGEWLLKHGVGAKPVNSEIDTPLNYGDYYFLEALLRFGELVDGDLRVAPRKAAKAKMFVDARHVPERMDDFVWENDYFGARAYGPGVSLPRPKGEGLVSSGFDIFNKAIPDIMMADALIRGVKEKISYHDNNGIGFDNYKVSTGRGVGGIGMKDAKGKWLYEGNWRTQKVLEKTADKVVFELGYSRYTVRGTMEKGLPFCRFDVRPNGKKLPVALIGPGLDVSPKRKHNGALAIDPTLGYIANYEPTDGKNGNVMTAIVLPGGGTLQLDDTGSMLLLQDKGEFTFYAGASWSGAGKWRTAEEWHDYVKKFATRFAAVK